jgi:hypothetical protein
VVNDFKAKIAFFSLHLEIQHTSKKSNCITIFYALLSQLTSEVVHYTLGHTKMTQQSLDSTTTRSRAVANKYVQLHSPLVNAVSAETQNSFALILAIIQQRMRTLEPQPPIETRFAPHSLTVRVIRNDVCIAELSKLAKQLQNKFTTLEFQLDQSSSTHIALHTMEKTPVYRSARWLWSLKYLLIAVIIITCLVAFDRLTFLY